MRSVGIQERAHQGGKPFYPSWPKHPAGEFLLRVAAIIFHQSNLAS